MFKKLIALAILCLFLNGCLAAHERLGRCATDNGDCSTCKADANKIYDREISIRAGWLIIRGIKKCYLNDPDGLINFVETKLKPMNIKEGEYEASEMRAGLYLLAGYGYFGKGDFESSLKYYKLANEARYIWQTTWTMGPTSCGNFDPIWAMAEYYKAIGDKDKTCNYLKNEISECSGNNRRQNGLYKDLYKEIYKCE